MTDELLPHYNRELSFIRRAAARFAEKYPKIAARLNVGPDGSGDPHVERLLQGFAYLNAHTRYKLDDDFPEITDALLGILYPHYQLPIPSMAIAEFTLDPTQLEIVDGHTIPAGAELETRPIATPPVGRTEIASIPCRFRTCYPVTLWPIDVKDARLQPPPFKAPASPFADRSAAVLRMTLKCKAEALRFADLSLKSLRFFLTGQPQHVYPLYEFLFNNVIGIALANSAGDSAPRFLKPSAIEQVGFSTAEGMLPYSARSFVGYRLLTEYFTFPEKFLFFDLNLQDSGTLHNIGNQLELFFFCDSSTTDLERNIDESTFRLDCAPIVNLYKHRTEPIQLTQTDWEYRVVPDVRRPLSHEVYSIDRVTLARQGGEPVPMVPFFATKHGQEQESEPPRFWHATRRHVELMPTDEYVPDEGTEVYLSIVDPDFESFMSNDGIVSVQTTCLNRDLPHRLPFGGGEPQLFLREGDALVSQITCLTRPTRTLRPAFKKRGLWRIMSHFSLNHLSLVGKEDQGEALREILKIYDFADSPETRATIGSILKVSNRRVTRRLGGITDSAVCRGLEVNIDFDEQRLTGSGLFLFASVLERFLPLYASMNSFTRLVATTQERGEWRQWPPRMGEKVLL